jgi:hypothetical protein
MAFHRNALQNAANGFDLWPETTRLVGRLYQTPPLAEGQSFVLIGIGGQM